MLIPIVYLSAWVGLAQAENVVWNAKSDQDHWCPYGSSDSYFSYHARPRLVPLQVADREIEIKLGFLRLFRREFNREHVHATAYQAARAGKCLECEANSPRPFISLGWRPPLVGSQPGCTTDPIPAEIEDQIITLLPPEETFDSFDENHLQAVSLLRTAYSAAMDAQGLLAMVRDSLYRHKLHRKAWYYALVGELRSRTELGIYPHSPIDATPDHFVTYSVLREARRQAAIPEEESTTVYCKTTLGLDYYDVRLQRPDPPSQVGQRKRRSNGGLSGPCVISNDIFDRDQSYTTYPTSPAVGTWMTGGQRDRHILNYRPVIQRDDATVPYIHDNPGFRKRRSTDKLNRMKRQTKIYIPYNGTRGSTPEENRLWYFREDMSLNEHHWFWHQDYPQLLGPNEKAGDRRGEIFFFTHHTIVARYNAERLSNGLPLAVPLEFRKNWDIGLGYDSDMLNINTGLFFARRVPNTPFRAISDTNVDALKKLLDHISEGYLLVKRSMMDGEGPFPVNLKSAEGISHLGNTVDGHNNLSMHQSLYQDVHRASHYGVAAATDFDRHCKLVTGIMTRTSMSLRDPAFYKVHTFVDNLYNKHLTTLQPYQIQGGEWPLQWKGVTIQKLEAMSGNGLKINHLRTFWSVRRFPLEQGIDGSMHEGQLNAEIGHQHLNHDPFIFRLTVDVHACAQSISKKGTVRIFMAPRYDLNGNRLRMEETRQLMFQLDAFPVKLGPGRNTITRNSQDSSATRPWSRTLTERLADPDNGGQAERCGCGWPDHLYIPKGTTAGMHFDLFAMITNFDQDQVVDSLESLNKPEGCNSAYLYCGRPNRKYPDARSMGYPFDRLPYYLPDNQQD